MVQFTQFKPAPNPVAACDFFTRQPIEIWIDDGVHIASCQILGLQSTGNTQLESIDHLKEEIKDYIFAASEMGTLQEILSEHGAR